MPLCFPPHSTHHLQPLDVGLFSSLAKAYEKRLRETSVYGAVNVTISQFLEILYEARLEAFTPANIAAWRGVGLIPYDPRPDGSYFKSSALASAILRDTHGNEPSLAASIFATASKIDSLVAGDVSSPLSLMVL